MFWFPIVILFLGLSTVIATEGDYPSLPERTDNPVQENAENPTTIQDNNEALAVATSTWSNASAKLAVHNGTRHAFFRSMDGDTPGAESRRVFGGSAAELKEFSAVCALLDRFMAVRCSATIVSEHWALTAAHCISPRITYVKYNTRRPGSGEGTIVAVVYLYRHPQYEVIQKDEGQGMDVTRLHHDVGLVRTKEKMALDNTTKKLLSTMQSYNPTNLRNREVQVLGFGRTEHSVLGEELFAVKLVMVSCERSEWTHCVCGVARGGQPRGVCSGDSGGPLVYDGAVIGVTSMGPIECANNGKSPPAGATSVFTSVYEYGDVINATIFNTDGALRMRRLAGSGAPPPRHCACSLLVYVLFLLSLPYV